MATATHNAALPRQLRDDDRLVLAVGNRLVLRRGADMKRWISGHLTVLAFGIVVVALVIIVVRLEDLARENRTYICRFVADLNERYDRGVKYQADVEAGRVPIIPGLTLADLQRSIDGQKATLESFRGLDCG